MKKSRGGQRPTERGTAAARFRQARAVFEAALDRPADERGRYVESACVGDKALLSDVRGMLAADERPESLLRHDPVPPVSNDLSSPDEGRFLAGTVLAGRYRILGLLGRGGMGEVYRAFDIILNQTVALKFLTESRWTESALVRFRNEVRIARQVSHPNVCRVYDLGMVDGLNFLSMEYIDGEDLASLLRRIGRLPEDKAMEFTRRICAGLAAAHERGILHRDLKPANVMIDNRGQVRITDFGLAGLVEEIPLSDLGSGTPAYMAPEQKAGKEVSVRSDIYSLGMILHEMFTGHARDRASSTQPTDYVKGLDPGIERVILQCLAEDPRARPGSALRVAMLLPGGNAIAAALAAGETPSPEAVAASEEKEGFEIRAAIACMGIIVALFVAGLVMSGRFSFLARAPLTLDPAALDFEARSLLGDLGYTELPADVESGWLCCDNVARERLLQSEPNERDEMLANHRPPVIQYFYRQHRSSFPLGPVTFDAPPNFEPGMIQLRLDAKARLLGLDAEPWAEIGSAESTIAPAIIDRLFDAADLDPSRFIEAEPQRLPSMMADARRAWTGSIEDDPDTTLRVESAFWQGRPVSFVVEGFAGAASFSLVDTAFLGYAATGGAVMIAAILLLLWHRARGNRLDRRGAFVLTGSYLLAGTADVWGGRLYTVSIVDILFVVAIWLIYLSVEPLVRRHWPDALISWTRLTRGQIRDSLVASHVLAGVVAALVFGTVGGVLVMLIDPVPPAAAPQYSLSGTIGSVPSYIAWAGQGVFTGLGFLAFVAMMRLAVRRTWIADLLAVAIFNLGRLIDLAAPGPEDVMTLWVVASTVLMIALIRRFGFLALLTTWVLLSALANTPPPVGGWMAGRLLALYAIPVVIAVWALWVIVTRRGQSSSAMAVRTW